MELYHYKLPLKKTPATAHGSGAKLGDTKAGAVLEPIFK